MSLRGRKANMSEPTVHNILSRLMEEKHTFTYKKLVVPVSMRSPYWKYYGFPATEEGDIITKVKIVCVLCKAQLAYNKNTSNLRMHLQNRHVKELMELIQEHPPETRVSPKAQTAQAQTQSDHDVATIRQPATPKSPKRAKYHKSLENTDSGFTKHGNVYFTPADGSIEIDGDLQFMSDPNITISDFAEDEEASSTIQILGSTSGNNSNVVLQPVVENRNISDAIAEFLILDLQHPDVVEGRGFQRLIATLRSPCEIPSRGRLVDEILPAMQCHLKETEQEFFLTYTGDYGITVEEWTSHNDEIFLTFSIHYQHRTEPQLETRVMSTVHCPTPGVGLDLYDYWTVFIDALFTEWHVNANKVTGIVIATDRSELIQVLASKNFILVPCLMFSLQESATFLLSLPEIHPVLNKCRALLGLIHRHPTALASLRMQEPELQVDEVLTTDLPAIWMTTYQMLEQTSFRRSVFPSILENVTELSAEQRLQFLLTDDEWSVVDDIVAALGPFKVAVLTLSEERFPLLSLLEPLLWQLCSSHLQAKDGDSPLAIKLKENLRENLASKYINEDMRTTLRTATMLDPRFKTLGYADDDVKEEVYDKIQKTLEQVFEQFPSNEDASNPPSKKARLSGMALLLGNVCEIKRGAGVNEKARLELEQFKSETSAPLDACPLQWWQQGAGKCPHLVHLARRYLSLPASVIPGQRIPLPHALIFYERRKILPPDQVDTMLFLNTNYNG